MKSASNFASKSARYGIDAALMPARSRLALERERPRRAAKTHAGPNGIAASARSAFKRAKNTRAILGRFNSPRVDLS
ncbi:hypothetical protein [Paraburkholderia sp. J41]|uniref:hypothetical protein n=1 Tax=Paraburkholderia sp. J41 TaxID=2805433 RepID=UPI002AC347AD|nr:hypothetical protein [Paraburkholderia sp. J41]